MSDITKFQEHLIKKGYDLDNYGADNDFGNETASASLRYIEDLCILNKVVLFPNNPYWIRMSDNFTDKFTDFLIVTDNDKVVSISNATTKAGRYWVKNPVTAGGILGTGVRVAGQTINSHIYKKGKNKWRGEGYFRQIATLLIYRDGNKDNKVDKNIKQQAPKWFGFFLHAMGKGNIIWNWSAGCLGAPLVQWNSNVDPYFTDGQIISDTIFEV
tara:strand:- start:714 stop:1355 length:642 start_codon:yes stop_codon:yes gene_type:complete